MISFHLIAAVLVSAARAGVLLPSKPGPAYSSSVFSQTFSRQDEPVPYLAQYAAPAQVEPAPQYVAQVPAQPITYVTGYQAPSPPIPTVAYVRSANDKTTVPKYEYAYLVIDPATGDHKSQQESRSGDAVRGEYALVQPDGSVRRVAYTADDYSGFNAVIRNYAPLSIPYDPCQNQANTPVIETTTTATAETRSKDFSKDCSNNQKVSPAESQGGNTKGQDVTKSSNEEGRGASTRTFSPLAPSRSEFNKVYRNRVEPEQGASFTTENSPTAVSRTEVSIGTQEESNARPGQKVITLTYDDIIRCLKAQTRGNIISKQGQREDVSARQSELAVLPASRSAIAYVATPFIFPTPKV